MRSLSAWPEYLYEQFDALSAEDALAARTGGAFSPVEQVWHLADLEREGFGVRIRRLRDEQAPRLPDFDGDRIARERHYRSLSLRRGTRGVWPSLARRIFATLQCLPGEAWARSGNPGGRRHGDVVRPARAAAATRPGARLEIEEWKRRQADSQIRPQASRRARTQARALPIGRAVSAGELH